MRHGKASGSALITSVPIPPEAGGAPRERTDAEIQTTGNLAAARMGLTLAGRDMSGGRHSVATWFV